MATQAQTSSRSEWRWLEGRSEFVHDGVGHPPIWAENQIHGCEGGCQRDDFPGRQPRAGDIALCGIGMVGVILHDERRGVTYPNGATAVAWVGVHLSPGKQGQPWSSRNPCVIGRVGDLLPHETIRQFVDRRVPQGWRASI